MPGKPRIGVSRCLLGDEVRHDGRHKRNTTLLEILGPQVEWVPVCPELEVGMGVPREAVHLVAHADGIRLLGVDSRMDWTDTMTAWARGRIEDLERLDLSGFVLKADSPSCGTKDVRVLSDAGERGDGRGVFADALLRMLPDLPVIDERELEDPERREQFIRRALGYHARRT